MLTIDELRAQLDAVGLSLESYAVGEGGSAVVHKAQVTPKATEFPDDTRVVAIKEYKDTILAEENQLQRVRQEADIGKAVNDPNVVRIFGLMNQPSGSSRLSPPLLMAMEWIDGLTLDQWTSAHGKEAPWDTIRSLALQSAAGLEALHKAQIFHRDIKPANLMIELPERLVVMDVGVAEITGDSPHTLHTKIKDFLGTTRYASPQYLRGDAFDPKDDIYSLGAALHLLMTGQEIYSHVERKPLLAATILSEQARVESLLPGVPEGMRLALEGCLNPRRERRPTIPQLREVLEHPESAAFLAREREEQEREKRGFLVLDVRSEGNAIFAGVGDETPSRSREYSLVRRIVVGGIATEEWIADVIFKHSSNGVANFLVHDPQDAEWSRNLVQGLGSFSAMMSNRRVSR